MYVSYWTRDIFVLPDKNTLQSIDDGSQGSTHIGDQTVPGIGGVGLSAYITEILTVDHIF